MKISLDAVMLDQFKKPIMEDDPENEGQKRPFTLRSVIVNALFGGAPSEKLDGPSKLENYRLALKIRDAGDTVDLTIPEASKILKRIDDAWSTVVVGQAHDLMEEKN